MSEYFRVLKRIQGDQREPEAPPSSVTPEMTAAPPPVAAGNAGGLSKHVVIPPYVSPEAAAALSTVLDNLRALANGRPTRTLVFAAVSRAESLRPVMTGLASYSKRAGLSLFTAEFTEDSGRPILRPRIGASDDHADDRHALTLSLHHQTWEPQVSDWLQKNTAGAELVVIEGRPLAHSIDAALMAKVCDGLVIVVQTGVTHRDALKLAAQRTRLAGCRALGVIVQGETDPTPAWIRRLFT